MLISSLLLIRMTMRIGAVVSASRSAGVGGAMSLSEASAAQDGAPTGAADSLPMHGQGKNEGKR